MKKAVIIIVVLLGCIVTSTAQKPSLELTFTAIDSAAHIQLDSIKVMNRTQGGDTVLYFPDTVLVLDYVVGVEEVDDKDGGLQVSQNYPNPVTDNTTISIYVPEEGFVRCLITDIMGRVVHHNEEVLESGVHSFSYTPGGGQMSFFTVQWKNSRETIKMLHPNLNQNGSVSLSHIGLSSAPKYEMKASEVKQGFNFALEDVLLYIGYIGGMESGILDAPFVSDTFYFQFATNIPCPGIPTVTYEGQVYNTIQIFSQCWMKENLNVGIMIDSLEDAEDNGIIEKYCLRNSEDSCDFYGGLYQWNEAMSYVENEGARGICPDGWHIPSESEWQILQGNVDSYFGIEDGIWSLYCNWVGEDVGLHLKSDSAWADNGNGENTYGFCAFPNGHRLNDGHFTELTRVYSNLWTSNRLNDEMAYFRRLSKFSDGTSRCGYEYVRGLGIRCIKD